jgi:hypothetical protein
MSARGLTLRGAVPQACTAEALQAVDAFVEREVFDAAFSLRMLEQSVRSSEYQR